MIAFKFRINQLLIIASRSVVILFTPYIQRPPFHTILPYAIRTVASPFNLFYYTFREGKIDPCCRSLIIFDKIFHLQLHPTRWIDGPLLHGHKCFLLKLRTDHYIVSLLTMLVFYKARFT